MATVRKLLCHLVGDYVLQSDWMALAKTHRNREGRCAAAEHAVIYTLCHLPLTRNPLRLALIGITHGLLDHYRPLPRLIHEKDKLLSPYGWPATKPAELPFWMHVVVDNTVHLAINEIALSWRRKP